MAPKRPSPLEEPPAASSSEEEVESEEIESEEEEESDEEDLEKPEQKHPQHKKASPSIPPTTPASDKKPETHQSQSSSSEEGSESGSESESDSDHPPRGVADPNVKPIASKPMDDASKPMDNASKLKKPRSKPAATATATPTKSTAKRPVENSGGGEGKDSKRAKKKGAEADGDAAETAEKKKSAAAGGEDSKKPLFQRLWSEEDEIVVLKSIIDYTAKNGADPVADLYAFHEFIKKSLHIDVTRTQLMDKMRRLRKKFENNAKKGKNGEDRTFSNPHERKTFELSKKIWGKEAINGGGVDLVNSKSNGKAKKSDKKLTLAEKEQLLASLRAPKDASPKKVAEDQNVGGPSQVPNESILLNKSIDASGLGESFMKDGLALIDSAKRSELEEKWRKQQVAEAEIFLRRIELLREQTKLVLLACKKH